MWRVLTDNGNNALADDPVDGNLSDGLAIMCAANVPHQADEGVDLVEPVIAEDGTAGPRWLLAAAGVLPCSTKQHRLNRTCACKSASLSTAHYRTKPALAY